MDRSTRNSRGGAMTPKEILAHWNSFDALTRHRHLSKKAESSINARLRNGYSEAELCQAITRYAELCQREQGPGYSGWGLFELMSRGEGGWIDKMLNPNYRGIETASERLSRQNAEVLGVPRNSGFLFDDDDQTLLN